jgi:hypothetical protein
LFAFVAAVTSILLMAVGAKVLMDGRSLVGWALIASAYVFASVGMLFLCCLGQ